ALDVKIDERVGLAARALDLVADGGVAEQRDRHFIKLHVAAASPGELGYLLPEHCREIGEECLDVGIGRAVGEIVAAVEMHGRWRGEGYLAGDVRDTAQEHVFVECQRLQPLYLFRSVGRRELDFMAGVVAEFERGGLDGEAISALNKTSPIGAAAEFTVAH